MISYVDRATIERSRRSINENKARAKDLRALAKICSPRQRGGYMSQASQKESAANRSRADLFFQMKWLKKNNKRLWKELNETI